MKDSNKKHNYFFQIFNVESDESIGYLHIYDSINIWKEISQFSASGYNIKDKLYNIAPHIIAHINDTYHIDNLMNNDNIEVYLITEYEYRQYDKKYDNECALVESLISEINLFTKNTLISEQLLIDNGFEEITIPEMKAHYKETYGQDDYSEWRLWTTDDINDYNRLKLDIDNGPNNRGTNWHLHIDNNVCESIGSADIDTVWEFNMLMKIFGSKFRL